MPLFFHSNSSNIGRCLFGTGLFFIQNLDDFLLEPHDLAGLIEMTIDTADIFGSDQIGIHVASIGQYVFHPPELTKPVKEKIDSVIGLESVELSIGGSNLIGALLAGNSNGMAVADIATESDIDALTSYGDVIVMEGELIPPVTFYLQMSQELLRVQVFPKKV